MTLQRLLLLHALITFAAGIVLIAAPGQIPAAIGIPLPADTYLICYLLGSAEIALAFLSFAATQLTDAQALRYISITFMVFHIGTAIVECVALAKGTNHLLWVNTLVRLLVAGLFGWFGVLKLKEKNV